MVVRYPHTATVTVMTTVTTNGETISETPSTTSIKGRFEPSEGTHRVKNPDGEYTDLKGKFFTKVDAITGARTLTVNGETFQIVRWYHWQTYRELWLD